MIVKLFLFALIIMAVCYVNGKTLTDETLSAKTRDINQLHHDLNKIKDKLRMRNRRDTGSPKESIDNLTAALEILCKNMAWHLGNLKKLYEEFNKYEYEGMLNLGNYFENERNNLTKEWKKIKKTEEKIDEEKDRFKEEKRRFTTNREAECKKLDICKNTGKRCYGIPDQIEMKFHVEMCVNGNKDMYEFTHANLSKAVTPCIP